MSANRPNRARESNHGAELEPSLLGPAWSAVSSDRGLRETGGLGRRGAGKIAGPPADALGQGGRGGVKGPLLLPRGPDPALSPPPSVCRTRPGGRGACRSICRAARPVRVESSRAAARTARLRCALCVWRNIACPLWGVPTLKQRTFLPSARHLGCSLSIESCSPDLQ